MILTPTNLHINPQQEELREQPLSLFNLAAYDGDIHQTPTGCIPPHWHAELELFVLQCGRVDVGIGDNTFALTAGDGCFINTGVLHAFYAADAAPCRYHSFVFDASIVSGMPGSVFDVNYLRPLLHTGAPFLTVSPDRDTPFFAPFSAAFDACAAECYGYEFTVRENLSHILLYLSDKTPFVSRPASSVQEKRLKQMLSWINKNIDKNMQTHDIAASASISVRECQRLFQRYLHASPIAYVRRQRILLAADLLSTTDTPVTTIALQCGFSSPSYFSSQFNGVIGKTPSDYRAAFCEK